MPCFELLGVQFCFPSLDEIAGAILNPVALMIASNIADLQSTLAPLFQNIIDTLSPFFQSVIDGVTGALSVLISGVQSVVDQVWTVIQGIPALVGGLIEAARSAVIDAVLELSEVVGARITGAINTIGGGLESLGVQIMGFVSNGVDTIGAGVSAVGNEIMLTVNGVGGALEGVINTALDGVGAAMGGLFEGFGSVDVDGVVTASLGVLGLSQAAVGALELHFSPITPEDAASWVPGFVNQVTGAVTSLHIVNVFAEAASLGQIDVGLQDGWKYPATAGSVKLATDLSVMNLTEGLVPAYKRHILSQYVPLIPDFQSLISIYVKEGYLEEHWVEMPEEMADNFRQLGYSYDWALRLWGQHWVYPGPTQLYEMLHRSTGSFPEIGVTEDTITEMLKLHDFEPKWRGPLQAISWNTWRIFDIRVGWEMELLSDEGLLNRLIDTGYHPKDAEILFQIQKMFVLRSEIDGITREADNDFVGGWISEEQLEADYAATPYNPNVQALRIARAKLRRDRDWRKDFLMYLRDLFIKWRISEETFKKELSTLGMVQSFIEIEVNRAKLRQRFIPETASQLPDATKPLTESRLLKLWKLGKLKEEEILEQLKGLGYNTEDAKLILASETVTVEEFEVPVPKVATKPLPAARILKLWKLGVLDEAKALERLGLLGYGIEDAKLILASETVEPEE